MLSLANRLALSYALFICLGLGALTLAVKRFTAAAFTALVEENIAERSREAARAVEERYDPFTRRFDAGAVEAVGMYFAHNGFIVSVEDAAGRLVWDARACDMEECRRVISAITARMEGEFGVGGALRREAYPLRYGGECVGTAAVETYGPFFYSETETRFLRLMNRLLVAATAVLTALGALVAFALSRPVARPILRAAAAARRLARIYAEGGSAAEGGGRAERLAEDSGTAELASLARSINLLAAELEEAERRQRRLVADIAHELRTPVTCLQGTVEAMIDGVYPADGGRLESCREEIARLARLIEDLNTLRGLEWERPRLDASVFDLGALLRACAAQFGAAAREKGVELRLRLRESPVRADYDRLKQVFVNLVANALAHTDAGSITISVENTRHGGEVSPLAPAPPPACLPLPPTAGAAAPATPPPFPPAAAVTGKGAEAARWRVTVADSGCGIAPDDLPHVFERLYRAGASRSRAKGGSGLGLAIAAAIVRAHGGTIRAESAGEGRGSAFTVELPGAEEVINTCVFAQ